MGSGGAERVLINVLSSLDTKKFDISLALIDAKNGETLQYIPDNVKVIPLWNGYTINYRLSYWISKKLGINFFLKRHLNTVLKHDFDVEISFLEGMPLKMHYLHKNKALNLSWVHIDLFKFNYSSYAFHKHEEQKAYGQMDKIICVSSDTKSAFLKLYPEFKDRTIVINNSIDSYTIKKKSSEINIRNDIFTSVTACRLTKQKGLDRLIRVAKKCKDANIPIKFQIIGEGPLRNELEKMAHSYGVEKIVFFMGYIDNPYPYIKAADIMLSTSIAEGFGLSICEAMALGTPVVSTNVSGPSEIIGDNEFGIICHHTDDDIFNAIVKLQKDKQLRANYANKGLQRVKLFDSQFITNQIEEIMATSKNKN